jgi:hypothetical protein
VKNRHSEVSERYIVRVYRRAKDDPKAIDGVVEVVDEARTVAFHDLATLCNTFLDNGPEAGRKG